MHLSSVTEGSSVLRCADVLELFSLADRRDSFGDLFGFLFTLFARPVEQMIYSQ